jgi:peptidoglycan/LPS O-acetylase OafA/YrhL
MGVIRLLLAISVLAGHNGPVLGLQMISRNDAVEFFFIISGFYMSLILRGKYNALKRGTYLFYENRFLRLYPTYLACALLSWGLFFGEYALMHRTPVNNWMGLYQTMGWWKAPFIFSNWTMVGQDIPLLLHYSPTHGFSWFAQPILGRIADGSNSCLPILTIQQAWSLGSEIWFYLMAPWILRRHWLLLLIPLALSLSIKFGLEHLCKYQTYFFFPAQCSFFIGGALLHRFYEKFQKYSLLPKGGFYLWLLIVGEIVTMGWFGLGWVKYVFYTTFLLSLPAIFAFSKKSIVDRHIGNLSYSFYLLHWTVLYALAAGLKIHSSNIAMLVTIVGSIAIYLIIERPIDGYRQDLVSKDASLRKPSPASPT